MGGNQLIFLFTKNALVPVGFSNRCQWMSKAPGEKPGVLERGHWSRYAGTGWKTVTYGRFQPVLKAGFPVVWTGFFLISSSSSNPSTI